MNKRRLFSLIITVLLLCTLLPTLAFAATVENYTLNDPPLAELASGNDMAANSGTITTNNGTVATSKGFVTTNNGTVTTNNGIVENNYGTVTTNNNYVEYNYGTVTDNTLGVSSNYGTVVNNYGVIDGNRPTGKVENNFGTITTNNGTVEHQFWQVTVKGGEHTTNTLTEGNSKLWIEDNTYNNNTNSPAGTAEFSPASGYTITAATTSNGTITKGTDGKWTLSGVTAAATVTLTAEPRLWQVTVTGGEHATVTGLTAVNGKQCIEEGKTAVFTPASGYAITAATTTDGTIAKNTDGTWTLSGVTAAATVTLTVTAEPRFWQVTVTGGEHATVTGLTTTNNKLWIKDGTSAVFSPASGYAITAATTTGNGTITKGTDGKWTLSGVTAAATVTLTVTAVPKTGVDRDTGILTALALVSGIILVTALPKKKTGVEN